jgi:hypothetical protein
MEPGPAQQLCHRGCEAPARIVAARMPPRSRYGQELFLAAVVSNSESPGHDVIAREETVRQPQRFEDERIHSLFERLARNLLDDPPEQVVPRLTVGNAGAKRRDQLQLSHLRHIALQSVIPFTGVGVDSPVEPGGVVEQVQHRDLVCGLLVLQLKLGNIATYRCVQLDLPLCDQVHERGRRKGLGDRGHEKQRVLINGERVIDARHTVTGIRLFTAGPYSDGNAGNLELLGGCFDEL